MVVDAVLWCSSLSLNSEHQRVSLVVGPRWFSQRVRERALFTSLPIDGWLRPSPGFPTAAATAFLRFSLRYTGSRGPRRLCHCGRYREPWQCDLWFYCGCFVPWTLTATVTIQPSAPALAGSTATAVTVDNSGLPCCLSRIQPFVVGLASRFEGGGYACCLPSMVKSITISMAFTFILHGTHAAKGDQRVRPMVHPCSGFLQSG